MKKKGDWETMEKRKSIIKEVNEKREIMKNEDPE